MIASIAAGFTWQSAVIIALLVIYMISYFLLKQRFENKQIKHISKMTKEFREEQTHWLEERKKLEQYLDRLTGELDIANENLSLLKSKLDNGSQNWDQDKNNFDSEISNLKGQITQLKQAQSDSEHSWAERQLSWQQEQQALVQKNRQLKQQLQDLQREKSTFENDFHTQLEQWENRCNGLQHDYKQSQSEKALMEDKLAEQHQWANQIQQALEEEIRQLSEQLNQLNASVHASSKTPKESNITSL